MQEESSAGKRRKIDGQKGETQSLLLALPGASGRREILKRLQSIARVIVLGPKSDLVRSAWARPLAGDDWIEWEGTTDSFDAAFLAVQAWLTTNTERRLDGIMTYDEFGVELCAYLGERFHLPCTPLSQVRKLRDKHRFRETCSASRLPCVRNCVLSCEEDVEKLLTETAEPWHFPSVLKPVMGAGSWHVQKVATKQQLREVFANLSKAFREGAFPEDVKRKGFTLEEFFDGHEVDVDGWARDGKVEFCVVSDNRPALEPYFLEIGGIYPSQLPMAAIAALKRLTEQVVAAFPGIHSCFHFEAKINVATLEVMPIEFNSRCGGAESPASVAATTGYWLPEVALRLALGLPIIAAQPSHAVVASTNFHVFRTGTLKECSDKEVDRLGTQVVTSVLFDNVGQPHVPNNGSQSCLGWMACGGETVEQAERNLETAISQVRIVVEP